MEVLKLFVLQPEICNAFCMSKFGELIDTRIPVLLEFYAAWDEASAAMRPVLKDVAVSLGAKAKVIRIDIDKNSELAEALRVKEIPALMIYKEGEMKWRQTGEHDANTLIGLVQEYV